MEINSNLHNRSLVLSKASWIHQAVTFTANTKYYFYQYAKSDRIWWNCTLKHYNNLVNLLLNLSMYLYLNHISSCNVERCEESKMGCKSHEFDHLSKHRKTLHNETVFSRFRRIDIKNKSWWFFICNNQQNITHYLF